MPEVCKLKLSSQKTNYISKITRHSPFNIRLYGAEYGCKLKSPPKITGKFDLSSILDILLSSASNIWIWANRISCLLGLYSKCVVAAMNWHDGFDLSWNLHTIATFSRSSSWEEETARERVKWGEWLTLNARENRVYRNSWLFEFDFVPLDETKQITFIKYCTSIGLQGREEIYRSHSRGHRARANESYLPYHLSASCTQRHSSSHAGDLVCHEDATAALPICLRSVGCCVVPSVWENVKKK